MIYSFGQPFKSSFSDLIGVAASGLCAIHCAMTPVIFVAGPIMERAAYPHYHGSTFWAMLDYVFLVLSLFAVWFSARNTSHKGIKIILWSAWSVFTLGLLSESLHFHDGILLMYVGSIALVLTHALNHRYCRKTRINLNHQMSKK